MLRHENSHEYGDRLQKELFDFLLGDFHLLDPEQTLIELHPLLKKLRRVRKQMAAGGWEARPTGKRSAADIAKMDLLFVNTVDGRYFVIDLTVNEKLKHKLSASRLCTMHVVCITTNEDDRPDLETKHRLLDLLLALMLSPSVLNLNDTHYPSTQADLTWGEKAEELELFIKRVDAKSMSMKEQHSVDQLNGALIYDAELLREYSTDLARLLVFLKQEHEVSTNQARIDQQVHFATFCATVLPQAARRCLTQIEDSWMPRQTTHRARYDRHRDNLLLEAEALVFRVEGISSLAIRALHRASGKVRQSSDELYPRKRQLIAAGGIAVIENLISITERAPLHVVLGTSIPVPAVKPVAKRTSKKSRRHKKKHQQKSKQP